MKLIMASFFFIVIVLLYSGNIVAQDQDVEKAKELWELAIEAKGGREQINKVQNILKSVSYGKEHGSVELFVLPEKWWRFSNEAEPLGKQVVMNNLAQDLYYVSYDNNPQSFTKTEKRGKVSLIETQLYFLLETKWIKPVPFDYSIEQIGGEKTNVVKTMVEEKPVNFYFDKKTHLVVKIAHLNDKGKIYSWVSFSDYVMLDGIQIPTKIGYESNRKSSTNIKFNVDYDETLFETPPTVVAGRDAWKPKQ